MALETAAERYLAAHPEKEEGPALQVPETWQRGADGRILLPTVQLLPELARRRLAGEDAGALALWFHESLAAQVTAALSFLRKKSGISKAALTGGVYQNLLFLRLTKEDLERDHFSVLLHSMVPPNDGGICLGQAVAALHALEKKTK